VYGTNLQSFHMSEVLYQEGSGFF